MDQDGIERRYFVEAAAKVLDVLESFDTGEDELTVTEVARRASVTYSSAFRLLYTLEKRGYVMRRLGGKKFVRTPARKRYRIGYAALDNSMKFCANVTRSMVLAARNYGIDLVVKDNETSPPKTLANLDSLLEEGIHLLIEYQANEAVAHLISTKCHEAQIPVIAVNFSLPGAYYFGGNNYLAGKLAGQFLSESATGIAQKGANKFLILPGKGMGSTQETRVTGILDGLRQSLPRLPKADILTAAPGLTTHDGYRATKDWLQPLAGSSKKMKILIAALTDPLGIGAARAIAKMGMGDRTCIVGQGGGDDARQYLRLGRSFKATVAYFPHTYGGRVMPLALKVLAGDKVPLIAYTDHVVLTEQNLPEYYPPCV